MFPRLAPKAYSAGRRMVLSSLDVTSSARMALDASSTVGIGTTSPVSKLHLNVSTVGDGLVVTNTLTPASNSGSGILAMTAAIPTAAGQRLGFYIFGTHDGAFRNAASISGFSSQAWTAGSAHGTYLAFATTPDNAAARTEVLRIDQAGNVGIGVTAFGTSAAKVLGLFTGTAPTTGPADTVQFYSSDDAAGHTIPSFFCEGTNVVATGQADSTSSVRVKMRINGTVRTFLCI